MRSDVLYDIRDLMSHLIFYTHEYKGAEKLKSNVTSVNLLLMPSSHINDGIRLYFAFRVY